MRTIRTITIMVLLAVMLMAYVTPIGAQDGPDELPEYTGGPAEIRFGWWGNDDRAARTQAVIELFAAAYPRDMCGLNPSSGEDGIAGFRHARIAPKPDASLQGAKARYRSAAGLSESGWHIDDVAISPSKL